MFSLGNSGGNWTSGCWRSCAPPGPDRTAFLRREYANKFEPEEVEYLMEAKQQWMVKYDRAAYVDLGVGETERGKNYTHHCAACLGWSFDQVPGDAMLLRDLLAGPWDESRFLIVPPHHVIALTADETIIRAVPPLFPP